MSSISIIKEFKEEISSIYGLYLDGTKGFQNNLKMIKDIEKLYKKNFQDYDPDIISFTHVEMEKESEKLNALHIDTVKNALDRNSITGINYKTLGNLCIVQVYQYWEDWYREQIALTHGKQKNELLADIFGDLRIYRQSIIHHRAIAKSEVEKCKLLKWFKEGQEIHFNSNQVKYIFEEIEKYLTTLMT